MSSRLCKLNFVLFLGIYDEILLVTPNRIKYKAVNRTMLLEYGFFVAEIWLTGSNIMGDNFR